MPRTIIRILAVGSLSFALLVSVLSAATIHVPGDQPTIQAGIDASVDGDTVLVADGTYRGEGNKNLDYWGRAITVLSENGTDNTVIDCENNGRGFSFGSGEDSFSRLDGFTITKGYIADDDGGGIYCGDYSSPSITNCIITGNTLSGYFDKGGGIYCHYYSYPAITNCIITENNTHFGGGIYCSFSSTTISNCTVAGNTASSGGGIYCFPHTSLSITNCTISENTANHAGGGIECISYSSLSITNCTISGNTANCGGGIYCHNSSPSILNCTISENTADDGGGIFCLESSPPISSCAITGNTVSGTYSSGGGIYCGDYSSPNITICTISENSAYDGGGIYCTYSSPIISSSAITGNISEYGGGGIYCSENSSPAILNCMISGNTSEYRGGGIYCLWNESSPSITNCTITGNVAEFRGGGIYSDRYSSPSITNCILWDDIPEEAYVSSGDPVITYSDIQGGWEGEGNIDTDPVFVKEDWGDYRLLWGSPCIDTGHPDLLDRDGTRIDLGAYFFDQSRELIIYLTPEGHSIGPGESGDVLYTVCNCHDRSLDFKGESIIYLPNGEYWDGNPLEEPELYTIHAQSNEATLASYTLPIDWPLGVSKVIAGIGFPGELYDKDGFEFTVVENRTDSE